MKVLLNKNIPNALLISIGLHILLLMLLGTLYRQRVDWQPKPVTEFDIVKIRMRNSVRPLKKVRHLPLQPSTTPENMQQMETIEVQPPHFRPQRHPWRTKTQPSNYKHLIFPPFQENMLTERGYGLSLYQD